MPPEIHWAVPIAILAGVWIAVALAGVKAFWLYRIWRLIRNIRPAPDSGTPANERDQVVQTFELIRRRP